MIGLRYLAHIALALVFLGPVAAQRSANSAGGGTLAEQIRSLSEQHGFRVKGIDKVVDGPARRTSGELNARLRSLLDDYNHVVESTATEISQVIILGAKTPVISNFSLKTARSGSQHSVKTTLNGVPGRRILANLLVDTGASTLVLPASLMTALGFRAEDLPERDAQTVNGRVEGRFARLAKVSVGGASVTDVEALFVDDDRLGEVGLLGMSFLKHFTMTINDADARLILTPH